MIFGVRMLLTLFIASLFFITTNQHVYATTTQLVITQIQTGASSSASQEYIVITNNSELAVDVTNWCVAYSSASDATQNQLVCFAPPNNKTKLMLPAGQSISLATPEFINAHAGYKADYTFGAALSGSSGHMKVIDSTKNIIDKVGWGSASSAEGSPVAAHPNGKVLMRSKSNGIYKDSDNNLNDFIVSDLALASSGNIYEEDIPVEPIGPSPIISELLPDADGADAGKEFIEFYNPTQSTINLKNFKLLISPSFNKLYNLPALEIEPNQYLALSDSQTGLVLPNTSASLKLVAANGEVVSTSDSYDELGENVAWIFYNNNWQMSYQPTPNAANILIDTKLCPQGQTRSEDTGTCRNTSTLVTNPTKCRIDQELNPLTNRCRKISALVTATECKPGQIRNLETGRCRTTTAANTKTPCKPQQVRNPQTGRCKNLATASAKQACKEGQERSDKTGRCKKISGLAKLGKVKDVKSALLKNNIKWWAAGTAATGSAGFAFYEWRREAWLAFSIVKSKLPI